jgi:hypothetical protein
MSDYKITIKQEIEIQIKKLDNEKNIDIKLDLKKYNFTNSVILSCSIDNKLINKLKYKQILGIIYNKINDSNKIISNTKLNIKLMEQKDKGFYYIVNLGISIQGVDSNKCLFEIINQCIKHKISLIMEIKLYNEPASIKLSFNN